MSEQAICTILENLQEVADLIGVDVVTFWEVCQILAPNSPLSDAIDREAAKRADARLNAVREFDGFGWQANEQ